MADQSEENKKEFSVEELIAWNVEKLRKYLKNRGIVITSDTRKRDLVSKVYHACRLYHCVALKNKTIAGLKLEERKSYLSMESCFFSPREIGKLGEW